MNVHQPLVRSFRIRPAVAEDHQAILSVAKHSRFTKDFSNAVMFSSPKAYQNGWIRVAVRGGEVLGFTCVREKVREPVTVLYFIGVHPSSRGCRVGEALFEDLVAVTRHSVLEFNVALSNPEALRFYRRLGCELTGESTLQGTAVKCRHCRPPLL